MRGILCCLLVLSAVAGAAPAWARGQGEAAKSIVTLNVLYPGEESDRMRSFLANEFRDRTVRDLGVEIRMTYAPWSRYWNTLDLMLQSGEPLDWYWDGNFSFSGHVARGQCQPIDGLLDTDGQDIKRVIPAANFQALSMKGRIYGIPSQYAPSADKFLSVLGREDLLSAVGITRLDTIAELVRACELIRTSFPQITPLAGSVWRAMTRELSASRDLHLTGSTEGLLYVVENEPGSRVYSTFEDRGLMRRMSALNQAFVQRGYVAPETLTEPQNDIVRFRNGRYAFENGAIARPLEESAAVQKNAPWARLREYLLSPGKPKYIDMPGNEVLFVSSASRNPRKVMQFFDWIWKDRANYEFAIYGVAGTDYTVAADRLTLVSSDMLFYDWMFRNLNYMRFPVNVTDEFIQDYVSWDKGARRSKLYGFAFDSTPVKAEAARVDSVWAARILPIINGFVPFDEEYDRAVSDLRAAGVERIRAEYQKQLQAFRSSRS